MRDEQRTNARANSSEDIIIAPLHRWTQLELHEVWEYRDLIWSFAARNFRVRYRQMALGLFGAYLVHL